MNEQLGRNEKEVISLVDSYEQVSQNGLSRKFNEEEYVNLSGYYSDNKEYGKAHDVLDDALVYYPYSTTFLICKSEILVEEKRLNDALGIISQAEAYSPFDFNILLLKADIQNQLGYNKQALNTLEKASIENDENLSELYLFKAIIHEQLEDTDHMFEDTKMALTINHENHEALEHMWWCVEITGKYRESINLHKQIISKDPYSYLAWYNLGYAFFNLELYEKAANAMEYSYLINQDFYEAYKMAAESYIHLKEYDKAMDCYTDLLGLLEGDSELYVKIGACYEEQENYEAAKSHYLLAIRKNNADHLAYFHLGEFYKKRNEFDKGTAAYLKAIQLDDRNELYYYSLADLYVQVGDFERAIPFFRQAADIAADVPDYWLDFANFYLERDMNQEALDILNEALQYTSGHEILYCKVACLYRMSLTKYAEKLLREALILDKSGSTVIFEYAPELETNVGLQLIISYFDQN